MVLSASTDNFTASADVTVPSNRELIIYPGKTLSFDSGTGLIANGELHVNAFSSNPVRFEPTGSSWAGIHLHGSGSSLNGAEIRNSSGNGISIFNTSDISLNYVEASGNSSYGFHIVNSTNLSTSNLRSEDNLWRGINIDGNNHGHLSDSVVKFSGDGLWIMGGATLYGLNKSRLAENWNGMVVRDGSSLTAWSNAVNDNGGRHAVAVYNSTIDARNNWWGQSPPDPGKFYAREMDGDESSIDYSGWLSSDPVPGLQQVSEPEDDITILASADGGSGEDSGDGHSERIRTLAQLRAALSESGLDFSGQLSALDDLSRDLTETARPCVEVVRIELLQLTDGHEQALSIGSQLFEDTALDEGIRRTAGRRMFYGYLLGLNQPDKAAALIPRLEELEDAEAESGQLAWLLELYGGQQPYESLLAGVSAEQEPFLTNYPNPFNPSTTVQFHLPATAEVTLRVYDILGREVAVLVNDRLEAGTHSVMFDGTGLSSGLYLYRLEAGTDVLTGRMVLVK